MPAMSEPRERQAFSISPYFFVRDIVRAAEYY